MARLLWYLCFFALSPFLSAGLPATSLLGEALATCKASLDTCSASLNTSLDSLMTCKASFAVSLVSSRATASSTTEVDPVFNTQYRSTMEIVWSCLTIIFASTWICVHPNVVGRDATKWQRLGKRLKLFALAVFAPELLAVWAFFQWKGCRELHRDFRKKALEMGISLTLESSSKGMNTEKQQHTEGNERTSSDAPEEVGLNTGPETNPSERLLPEKSSGGQTESKRNPWYWYCVNEKETAWTLIHAHFVQMGGIVFRDEQGNMGFREPTPRWRTVRVWDKTETEWVNKEIGWRDQSIKAFFALCLPEAFITDKSKGSALAKGLVITQVSWFVVQTTARKIEGLPITHLEVVCLAFTVFNLGMYVCWWDKPLDVEYPLEVAGIPGESAESSLTAWQKWWVPLVVGLDTLPVGHWVYSSQEKTYPSLYAFHTEDEEEGSSWTKYFANPGSDGVLGGGFTLALAFTSASFGALHAVGWSLPSPSHAEHMLWRVSCLVLVAYPLIPMVCIPLVHLTDSLQGALTSVSYVFTLFIMLLSFLGAIAYLGARLILIVLPFLELRALPPLAHRTVSWSNFLPHV